MLAGVGELWSKGCCCKTWLRIGFRCGAAASDSMMPSKAPDRQPQTLHNEIQNSMCTGNSQLTVDASVAGHRYQSLIGGVTIGGTKGRDLGFSGLGC